MFAQEADSQKSEQGRVGAELLVSSRSKQARFAARFHSHVPPYALPGWEHARQQLDSKDKKSGCWDREGASPVRGGV